MRARLYAQSQRGVAIVRAAIDDLGRPDIRMGSRQAHGLAHATRVQARRAHAGTRRKGSAPASTVGEPRGARPARKRALSPGDHDPTSFHIHPLNLALALASDIERRGGQVMSQRGRSASTGRAGWRLAHAGRRESRAPCVLAGMPILAGVSRGLRAPSCRWRPMSR